MVGRPSVYGETTGGSYSRVGTSSKQGVNHLHLEIKCYRWSIPTLHPSLPVYSVKWVKLWIWSSCLRLYIVNETFQKEITFENQRLAIGFEVRKKWYYFLNFCTLESQIKNTHNIAHRLVATNSYPSFSCLLVFLSLLQFCNS